MGTPVNATRRVGASVGIIGGGVFGVTIALELASSGFPVTLYERRGDILTGATARNFFRVHRGYHYPRDPATAESARDGYTSFSQTFSEAFVPSVPHHYAIAASGSRTTAEQFEQHCHLLGLRARPVRLPDLVPGSVAACFEVDEAYYDVNRLRKLAWERLRSARAEVVLKSTQNAREIAKGHDFLVVAAYGSLNEILIDLDCPPVNLQYELCEVPVVHAPGLGRSSLVVLDGPFVSVAPYGEDCHALYDVANSVHKRSVGRSRPGASDPAGELSGLRMPPPGLTRLGPILSSVRQFLANLSWAAHIGSFFAERVVVPGLDSTDARPTLVSWASPNVISVLSGKVSTSVDTGRLIARSIAARSGRNLDCPPSPPVAPVEDYGDSPVARRDGAMVIEGNGW